MRELTPFIGVLVVLALVIQHWWVFLIAAGCCGGYLYLTRQEKRRATAITEVQPPIAPPSSKTPVEPVKLIAVRPKPARKSPRPTGLAITERSVAAPPPRTKTKSLQVNRGIVRVKYQPLSEPFTNTNSDGGYAYIWPYKKPPAIGQRVIVPTLSEPENEAVIVGIGPGSNPYRGALLRVTKVAGRPPTVPISPSSAVPYAHLTRKRTPWPAAEVIYTAVDLETTGLNPVSDRIVEIGLVKFAGDGTVLDEFATLINNPGSPIGAREVHQIDDADLTHAPSTADALREAFAFMAGTVVVAHKWEFEEGFLAAAARQHGLKFPDVLAACTWRTARRQLDGRGYSLKILYKSATGEFQNDAHTALSDARAVRKILMWLFQTAPSPLNLTAGPPQPSLPPYTGGDCLISCRPAAMGRADMAGLINAFPQSPHPRAGNPDEVENYLALLAECVEDGKLTDKESRELIQQVQRTRLTGTQIRYVHELAWQSQFPDYQKSTSELDPAERSERYLMAEALGLTELAEEIGAVMAELAEPEPDPSARYLRSLRIGIVGDTAELRTLRLHAAKYGARIAVKITKTVQWMATVTPESDDTLHNSARRLGIVMVTPDDGTARLDEAAREAELRAAERQRHFDAAEAGRHAYLAERENYWRPVWRQSELDYDPEQESY